MNIVDLILNEPEQANAAIAASMQARVFDYLDNYQIAEEETLDEAAKPKGTWEVWEKSHSATGQQRFKSGKDEKVAEFDHPTKAAKHASMLGGDTHGVYVKRKLNEESVDEASNTVTKDKNGKIVSWKHEGDWVKSKPTTDKQSMAKVKADTEGARKWSEKLTKEDLDAMDQEEFDALVENFEQLDELSKATLASYMTKNTKESEKKNSKQSMADKMKRIDGYWKASDKLSK